MYKRFTAIIIIIIFLNSASLRAESKNMKRIGKKGLRLTRVNVKQSQEIEKVYETVGSEDSDDYANQHAGVFKFWPPEVIPPEASSIQKQGHPNQENAFNLNRKSLESKTAQPLSTKKQSKINPKEIESKTMKIGNKMRRRYEKGKVKESNKSFEGRKKERISETKAEKKRNFLEEIKSDNRYQNNFRQPIRKSEGFSTKSMKIKPDLNHKIASGETFKTGTKKVRNFPGNDKLKHERGNLRTDDTYKTRTTKAMTEIHFNNKSHYKLGSLGSTEKPERKTDNIRKENRKIKTTLSKAYSSLRNTKTTIEGNNALKPGQEKRNEHADMNVANIVNSFIKLPLQVQRRVIDEVLSRQHNFKRVSETNRTTSVILPLELSTTSAVLSKKYSATSVLPKAYSTASTDFPEAYTTMSVDLSETYSISSGDFSEDYSITSVDLLEVNSTPLVDPTGNNPEVLTSEEHVSQLYENGSSPKTSEEAKFNSIMLKEFSELYSIAPPTGVSPSSRDFPSVSEEKFVHRRSLNKNQNRQNFFSHQEGSIPRIRPKKNKGYFPKNDVADIAGTLYNYFARVPQNKKRGIHKDIPRKLKNFFDRMSKPATMKSTRDLKRILTPVLITVKPRETDSTVDYDQIRMREFYYSDYDEATENDVMDTLGDLSEEFAM
ncbi:hypothetical protein AVEN_272320-1 [Araneus ventricosus]|uniref:Uncharacterized protein n=1 Tax=Araneus ventricosus TaxID=182803 RepID=A0A4Y2IYQ4_ARAVE|nr:hypothetical protein AVEN_272320-1 [Araneus ventricosus]